MFSRVLYRCHSPSIEIEDGVEKKVYRNEVMVSCMAKTLAGRRNSS